MAWIRVLSEAEVREDKQLERMYRSHDDQGIVDNILQIHSLHPASLRAHLMLYRTLMHGPSPLSRAQREMIAVSVSAANHCHY
jgi:uncharacterized peroxidase-related enzyme